MWVPWGTSRVPREPVVADHPVGEHREIVQGTVAIEPQRTPAIDRIDKHQFAGDILRRVGRRKLWSGRGGGCHSPSLFSWAKARKVSAQVASATLQPNSLMELLILVISLELLARVTTQPLVLPRVSRSGRERYCFRIQVFVQEKLSERGRE